MGENKGEIREKIIDLFLFRNKKTDENEI